MVSFVLQNPGDAVDNLIVVYSIPNLFGAISILPGEEASLAVALGQEIFISVEE